MSQEQNNATALTAAARKVSSNDLIVGKILDYMNVKDLKACRLVEKSIWFPKATKLLKRRSIINFNGPYDESDNEQPFYKTFRSLEMYLQQIPNFQTENFSLGLGFKQTEHNDEYEPFFQKFGSQIKHLRIDYYYDVRILRSILVHYVPNLEVLDFRRLPDKFQETENLHRLFPEGFQPPTFPRLTRIEIWNNSAFPRRMSKEFVDDLFSICPNINSIKIVDRYYRKITEFVLSALRSNPELLSNVRKLELDCCGSPTDYDLNIMTQMKLRVLHLGVIHELACAESIQCLLNSQCKTLEDLQLGNIKVSQPMKIQLPRFEMLSRLELTTDIPNGAPFGFSFGSISYPQTFPRLKYLINNRNKNFFPHDCMETSKTYSRISARDGKKFFTGMSDLWSELFPPNAEPFPHLIELDIPFPKKLSESSNNKFYYRLCTMFPNVDNEFFRGLRDGSIKIEPTKPKKKIPKKVPIPKVLEDYNPVRDRTSAYQRSGHLGDLFESNDGGPSVNVLRESISWDVLPDNVSVKVDYGFINCKTEDEESHLLSVYTAIIKIMECDLQELHQACIQGRLANFIIDQYTAYNQLENYYCQWFLKNRHLVKNPYPLPDF